MSALSGLVPGLYIAVDDIKGKRKASIRITDDLASSVQELNMSDITARRAEFASILLLYHLSHSANTVNFHTALLEMTDPPVQRLHPKSKFGDSNAVKYSTRPLVRRDQLTYALRAYTALSAEQFDPLTYFRLLRDPDSSVSAYERIVLSWAEERVRERAWEVMRRAYISTEITWTERFCGLQVDDRGWIEQRGGRVEGTIVKLR